MHIKSNEKKLEITKRLEELAEMGMLDNTITILNLPAANYCEKRAEMVEQPDGTLEQSCKGCVTQGIISKNRLTLEQIKNIIDFFADNYGTRFITINGRGDPFEPRLKEETLEKIRYAYTKGIQAYVFTAGNNLDEATCKFLAEHRVNVMISLYGNQFIDADFFSGKEYPSPNKPLQNKAEIAANLRRLIDTYLSTEGQIKDRADKTDITTRIGMNYVVSVKDLSDQTKIRALKEAANLNGIYFVSNTNFEPHPNADIQTQLEKLTIEYNNFHLRHSTVVNGQCQMGAGSSATVDFDGELYRCPYMSGKGDGNFIKLTTEAVKNIIEGYMQNRQYVCVMRRTLKK
ncbi:hypothetical protein HY636_01730 [Candidatus Woesearchaeota archaeon]|nr:hypothetical protein [Candidatus Woesearchaeota archaeon]